MRNVSVTFRNRRTGDRRVITTESNNIPMAIPKARVRLFYLAKVGGFKWNDFVVESACFTNATEREATVSDIDRRIRMGQHVSVREINQWARSTTGMVTISMMNASRDVA